MLNSNCTLSLLVLGRDQNKILGSVSWTKFLTTKPVSNVVSGPNFRSVFFGSDPNPNTNPKSTMKTGMPRDRWTRMSADCPPRDRVRDFQKIHIRVRDHKISMSVSADLWCQCLFLMWEYSRGGNPAYILEFHNVVFCWIIFGDEA